MGLVLRNFELLTITNYPKELFAILLCVVNEDKSLLGLEINSDVIRVHFLYHGIELFKWD